MNHLRSNINAIQARRAAIVPEQIKTANQLEEAENQFWENGGMLSTRRSEILKAQQDLQHRDSELRENALNLAANPEVSLLLCHKLVSDTYNRLQQSNYEQTRRYSFPIISMYRQLLERFEGICSKESTTYHSLSNLMQQQLNE